MPPPMCEMTDFVTLEMKFSFLQMAIVLKLRMDLLFWFINFDNFASMLIKLPYRLVYNFGLSYLPIMSIFL